ncbi:MAG: response regulator transcription factor [Anaerolineae bacterium]|nr:response regulator transcription factor [Anaerolineae bacterium]
MKVLVVDDDLALADVIAFTLRRAGFHIVNAYDGVMAVERWRSESPDVIVLDLNLPKMDGLAVCQHIRAQTSTPIIMLSVNGEDDDVVRGLELGADDYLTKPFSPRQLVARIKAVMRRAGIVQTPGPLSVGDLTLDIARREVTSAERDPVQLTQLECRFLEVLMLNAGQVLPAETIIQQVWGISGGDKVMLKQLVHRLRQKIEPRPSEPAYIETIPGVGYALVVGTEA